MAQAATTVTTSGAGGDFVVTNAWRIVQAKLAEGIQYNNLEWDMAEEFTPPEDTPYSARQTLVPLDINEGAGVASIPEFGDEARPSSPNLAELTLTMVQFNKRFNASMMAKYADKGDAQVKRQLLFQGAHAIRDLSRHYSDYFYGVSNAYLAQVNSAQTATTMTVTLIGGYGVAGITSPTFISDKFRVNDWVALIRAGALVSNAIGRIGSITKSTGVAVITWNGSVVSASGDYVVKANSMENTTVAGTDYTRGLVGLIDVTTTASVHGLSNATNTNWDPAYADTSGGRMTGARLRRGRDEMEDLGGSGGKRILLLSRGVYRNWVDLERTSLRQTDGTSMETDGDIKNRGTEIISSKRVPPGYAFMWQRGAYQRWSLLPKPDGRFTWGDGKEYENKSGMVFRIDMPVQMVVRNRRLFSYWTSLSET